MGTNLPYTRAQFVTSILSRIAFAGEYECWLWRAGTMNCGYGVCVWRGKMRPAHRVMWEIANGQDAPDDKDVLHACDTPLCVNPNHLSLGTPRDNALDMLRKKRYSGLRFKPEQVQEIRETLKNYRRGACMELARKYDVDPRTIYKIRDGISYQFVEHKEPTDVPAA